MKSWLLTQRRAVFHSLQNANTKTGSILEIYTREYGIHISINILCLVNSSKCRLKPSFLSLGILGIKRSSLLLRLDLAVNWKYTPIAFYTNIFLLPLSVIITLVVFTILSCWAWFPKQNYKSSLYIWPSILNFVLYIIMACDY